MANAHINITGNSDDASASLDRLGRSAEQAARRTGSMVRDFNRLSNVTNEVRFQVNESARAVDNFSNALQGAFIATAAREIYKITNMFLAFENQLLAVGGSLTFAKSEMKWLVNEVRRLGADLSKAGEGFVKMNAAARGTSTTTDQVRFVWSRFSEALMVTNAGALQVEGTFRALIQMMNKGVVMSEELKGQLAEHLPGAFQIAARAYKVSTKELTAMLERRELMPGEFWMKMASQLEAELGPAIARALQTPRAEFNRFTTEVRVLTNEIGTALSPAFMNLFQGMTAQVRALNEGIQGLNEVQREFASYLGGAAVGALAAWIALELVIGNTGRRLIDLLGLFSKKNALSIFVTLLGLAAGALYAMSDRLVEFNDKIVTFGSVIRSHVIVALDEIKTKYASTFDSLSNRFESIQQWAVDSALAARDSLISIGQNFFQFLKNQINFVISAFLAIKGAIAGSIPDFSEYFPKEGFANPIIAFFVSLPERAREAFDYIVEQFQRVRTLFAEAAPTILAGIATSIVQTLGAVKQLLDYLSEIAVSSGLADIFNDLPEKAGEAFDFVVSEAKKLGAAIKAALPDALDFVKRMLEDAVYTMEEWLGAVKAFVDFAAPAIVGFGTAAVEWLAKIRDSIAEMGIPQLNADFDRLVKATAGAALGAALAWGAVTAAVALANKTLKISIGLQIAFNALSKINPWAMLITVLGSIAGTLYALRNDMVEFGGEQVRLGSVIRATWDVIANKVSDFFAVFSYGWSYLVVQFDTWMNDLSDAFTVESDSWVLKTYETAGKLVDKIFWFINMAISGFKSMGVWFGNVMGSMVENATDFAEHTKRIFSAVWQDIFSGDFKFTGTAAELAKILSENAEKMGRQLEGFKGAFVYEEHIQNLDRAFTDAIGGAVDSTLSSIKDGASRAAGAVVSAFTKPLSDVKREIAIAAKAYDIDYDPNRLSQVGKESAAVQAGMLEFMKGFDFTVDRTGNRLNEFKEQFKTFYASIKENITDEALSQSLAEMAASVEDLGSLDAAMALIQKTLFEAPPENPVLDEINKIDEALNKTIPTAREYQQKMAAIQIGMLAEKEKPGTGISEEKGIKLMQQLTAEYTSQIDKINGVKKATKEAKTETEKYTEAQIELAEYASRAANIIAQTYKGTNVEQMTSRLKEHLPVIDEMAKKYDVARELIIAVMAQESKFNMSAVSKAGATGLMQIMPKTGKMLADQMGKDFDYVFKTARGNVEAGVKYLSQLLEKYDGDVTLALRGYNAGPGATDAGRFPEETQKYVATIIPLYKALAEMGGEANVVLKGTGLAADEIAEKLEEARKAIQDVGEEYGSAKSFTREYRTELAKVKAAYEANELSADEYKKAVEKINDAYAASKGPVQAYLVSLKESLGTVASFAVDAFEQLRQKLVDGLVEGKLELGDFVDYAKRRLAEIAVNSIIVDIGASFFSTKGSAESGKFLKSFAGIFGSVIGGLGKLFTWALSGLSSLFSAHVAGVASATAAGAAASTAAAATKTASSIGSPGLGGMGSWFGGNSIGQGYSSAAKGVGAYFGYDTSPVGPYMPGSSYSSGLSGFSSAASSLPNWAYGGAGLVGGLGGGFLANSMFGGKGYSGIGGSIGGAGGAQLGMTIGMSMGGPVGAAIGAILGTLAGGAGGGFLGSLFGGGKKQEPRADLSVQQGYMTVNSTNDAWGDATELYAGAAEINKALDELSTTLGDAAWAARNAFTTDKQTVTQENAGKWMKDNYESMIKSMIQATKDDALTQAGGELFGEIVGKAFDEAGDDPQAIAAAINIARTFYDTLSDYTDRALIFDINYAAFDFDTVSRNLYEMATRMKESGETLVDTLSRITQALDVSVTTGFSNPGFLDMQFDEGGDRNTMAYNKSMTDFGKYLQSNVDYWYDQLINGSQANKAIHEGYYQAAIAARDAYLWVNSSEEKNLFLVEKRVKILQAMADKMGGMEQFNAAQNSYYDLVYTDEEKAQKSKDYAQGQIGQWNQRMGFSGDKIISNADQLKEWMESLDLTTEAGQNAYVAGLQVAQMFSILRDSMDALGESISSLEDFMEALKPPEIKEKEEKDKFEKIFKDINVKIPMSKDELYYMMKSGQLTEDQVAALVKNSQFILEYLEGNKETATADPLSNETIRNLEKRLGEWQNKLSEYESVVRSTIDSLNNLKQSRVPTEDYREDLLQRARAAIVSAELPDDISQIISDLGKVDQNDFASYEDFLMAVHENENLLNQLKARGEREVNYAKRQIELIEKQIEEAKKALEREMVATKTSFDELKATVVETGGRIVAALNEVKTAILNLYSLLEYEPGDAGSMLPLTQETVVRLGRLIDGVNVTNLGIAVVNHALAIANELADYSLRSLDRTYAAIDVLNQGTAITNSWLSAIYDSLNVDTIPKDEPVKTFADLLKSETASIIVSSPDLTSELKSLSSITESGFERLIATSSLGFSSIVESIARGMPNEKPPTQTAIITKDVDWAKLNDSPAVSSNGGQSRVAESSDQIERLITKVEEFRSESNELQTSIAIHSSRTADIVSRWEGDGIPPDREDLLKQIALNTRNTGSDPCS